MNRDTLDATESHLPVIAPKGYVDLNSTDKFALSAGAVKYTNCFSVKE